MDAQNRSASQPPGPLQQSAQFPRLPSLEHLKKQAKHLLAACERGDADALDRLRRRFPGTAAPFKLSHAQLAVAREHGSASWAQLRSTVLQVLLERLAVRHWSEWRAAAAARAALLQAGDDGVRAVREQGLTHPEPRVRRGAIDFLQCHADPCTVPKLTELALHDPIPYVRWSAVRTLKAQRVMTGAEGLDQLLVRVAAADPSPRVRRQAVGGLDAPSLVRIVVEDPSAQVRARAAAALGSHQGSALAREVLEAALRDPHPDVRGAAHQTLRRISPEYHQMVAERARQANLAGTALPARPMGQA